MIEAQYYQSLYLFIVTVLTVLAYNDYTKNGDRFIQEQETVRIDYRALCLVVIFAFFIGLRPIYSVYFGDTGTYTGQYKLMEGINYVYNPLAQNKIWDNLLAWWASNRFGISEFYILTALIYFGCTWLACRKLFGQDQYIAFLTFLGSFSTFSYSTNGIKAGAAGAIFLLGLSYYRKWIICIPLILISWGIHHSMTLPVVAFAAAYLYRKPKLYFYVWLLCLIISALHITYFQTLFASMAEDQGDMKAIVYLMSSSTENWGGKSGFRLDFVLYSAMPLWIGYYAMFKKRLKLGNTYKLLLSIYMISNSVWMLCMYAQFTNRIAYLSWFLYPVVLIYPYLKLNWGPGRYKVLSKVVMANLAFTLFMQTIYYNVLK